MDPRDKPEDDGKGLIAFQAKLHRLAKVTIFR